ncbi:AMP-binding protein [Frankia sp. EAN1pec]|uniref:AMP-binding protein n=1 Tax=Parafrankia sp. (strain EAN1pec) TaxID=298653 RepID=UPI00067482B7
MAMDQVSHTRLAAAHWPAAPSPHSLDVTVGDALREAARRRPDRIALVDGTEDRETRRQWTYAELLDTSLRWARALRREFDPGDRVAVWATNCPEWILFQFGTALAGLTLVTVNPAYRSSELGFVLRQSRAQGILVQRELRGRDLPGVVHEIADQLPELRWVMPLDQWVAYVEEADPGDVETDLPPVRPEDPVQIQYTSGTTGFPKGAYLAHQGMALNARLYAEAIGASERDTWVNPLPLFHTAGCGLATLGILQTGGCHVLPQGFETDLMFDLIDTYKATVTLGVPTMFIRMLEKLPTGSMLLDSLRIVTTGGAPVPVELVRRLEKEFGVMVAIGFGQTESSPYITHTRPGQDLPHWAETVGRPLPRVEVKISRPDGSVADVDEGGEICTRGVCVMKGYFENPEATSQTIDQNGWLHTGDVGTMDSHGYVRVLGRFKDLIIRGGENIYPRDVEAALSEHPDVTDVAVVGLPDGEWGEIVGAFVQTSKPLTADGLQAFLRGKLASYKIPQVWRFPKEFP